jgi:hypothetical protein
LPVEQESSLILYRYAANIQLVFVSSAQHVPWRWQLTTDTDN